MKLKSNELIGLNNWDALGESIVGIITKISANNYLSWHDVKSLFLHNPKPGEIPFIACNAAHNSRIDLTSIESLFCSETDINKSFCDFYLPDWIRNDHSRESFYESKLRICPKCVKIGKHLCIHQVKLFSYCPIHNAKLQYTCTKCSAQLGGWFGIDSKDPKLEFFSCFKCKVCGCENLSFERLAHSQLEKYQKELTFFLKTYESWLGDINTQYSERTWINILGNLDFTQIALEISGYPEDVAKKLNYRQIYLSGKVTFETGRLSKQQFNDGSLSQRKSTLKYVLKELLLFSHEQLLSIEKRFGVTKRQYSTSCLLRPYPDNYWGENYSIWTQSYVEVCYAVKYRYTRAVYINEEISTHYWLIRMWYAHFAEPLLEVIDITDEKNLCLLLQLSNIWIRKFIIQLLLNELYRLSKGLVGESLKSYSRILDMTGEFEPFYSLVVAFKFNAKINEMQIWHKWGSISNFKALYESGFVGYSPKKRDCYNYYKMLHQLFRLRGKHLRHSEYLEMISKQSITKIGGHNYL